jgi:exodeoxyribonuclease VII large subunit
LQFAFEQLKKKLAAEGLFEQARKRPLPRFPRRIGIVTSPRGAVIRDLLHVLGRRFPGLHLRVFPALVQGEGSVEEVCQGLAYFSQSGWADVVILARGGGSIEDLWTFNEEAVARAIAACATPVVSAIGHETDFTIADFVADLRAPTPSAAAEMVVRTRQDVLDQIDASARKVWQALRYRLAQARRQLQERGVERATSLLERRIGRSLERVDELDYWLRESARRRLERARSGLRDPAARLARLDLRLRIASLFRRLETASATVSECAHARLAQARARFEPLAAQLTQLSPLGVLERGYALVQDQAGRILKEAGAAPPDSEIRVRLARGRLKARVTESTPTDS